MIEQAADVDFCFKVLDLWCDFSDDKIKGRDLRHKKFQRYLIDTWGFELYNKTERWKQNYPQWRLRIHDEQKYLLFLLRY